MLGGGGRVHKLRTREKAGRYHSDYGAVVLLPSEFESQVAAGADAAIELEQAPLSRQPAELFAAEDDIDWGERVGFFSRTRESGGRRKGLVEVQL